MSMATMQTARAQLFVEIEQLSGRYLAELESFVQFLKFKQAGAAQPDDSRCRVLAPEADPLLQAVGAVDAVPFAEHIDDALYGSL
jgi:hypothetical protein